MGNETTARIAADILIVALQNNAPLAGREPSAKEENTSVKTALTAEAIAAAFSTLHAAVSAGIDPKK